MEITTSAGVIDTGSYTPQQAALDALSMEELEMIRDTIEKEAINISFQIERVDGMNPDPGWLSRTTYALKMRRHNVGVLERYMKGRREQFEESKSDSFSRYFVEATRKLLTAGQFDKIRDLAIGLAKDDMNQVVA